MSIADFFESGEMKEHQGAFKNLVMIARADGDINEIERKMLDRMARRLDISDEHVAEILAHPERFPVTPPHTIQDRRERMVDLVRMVLSDGDIEAKEMNVLVKCGIGLGYQDEDIPQMVNRIRHFLNQGLDRDDVIDAMLADK